MHLIKILNNKIRVIGGALKVTAFAWILDLVFWNDGGIWKDDSFWND
jgi:hypothetical protein